MHLLTAFLVRKGIQEVEEVMWGCDGSLTAIDAQSKITFLISRELLNSESLSEWLHLTNHWMQITRWR